MPHTNNKLKYTIFGRRIALVGIAQTITSLKGLIILPILTQTLGAADYGIWALILVTISLLQPFILLGMNSAILRFLSSKKKKEIVQGFITTFFIIFIVGTIASLIVFLSSDYLAITILKEESAASLIKIASPLILIAALNTLALGLFRVFGLIKIYSIVIISQTFLEVGFIALLVLSGYGLIGAVISILIIRVFILAVELCLIINHAGYACPDFSVLRPYLTYGLPLVPTVVFEFIVASSDRYVIGFFASAEKVGIYSAAYGLGAILLMFSSFIMYILRPTIYSLHDKKNIENVKNYLSYSWKYLLMLSIPSAFGLSILAKPLLIVLTASEFVSEGIIIIPLIAFSTILYGAELLFGAVLLLNKRTSIFAIVFGSTAIINLVLNFIFIPRWGIIGAAITTLIAYAIASIAIFVKSRQQMKFDIRLYFIVKCIISSCIMILCIWLFNPVGTIKLFISIVFGIVLYFTMLFLLKGFKKGELRTIGNILGLKFLNNKFLRYRN